MIERFSLTLEEDLREVVRDIKKFWTSISRLLEYRSPMYDLASKTSAKIIFANELMLPCDLEFSVKPTPATCDGDNYAERQDDLNELHNFVRNRIKVVSDKTNARYGARSIKRTNNQIRLGKVPRTFYRRTERIIVNVVNKFEPAFSINDRAMTTAWHTHVQNIND